MSKNEKTLLIVVVVAIVAYFLYQRMNAPQAGGPPGPQGGGPGLFGTGLQ